MVFANLFFAVPHSYMCLSPFGTVWHRLSPFIFDLEPFWYFAKTLAKTNAKLTPTLNDDRSRSEECYCLRLRVLRLFASVLGGGWPLKRDLSLAIVSTDHGSMPTFDSGSQLSFGLALPALRPNRSSIKHDCRTSDKRCGRRSAALETRNKRTSERVSRIDRRPIV
jgi:hypothetical protein